jgi:hypothetical protein
MHYSHIKKSFDLFSKEAFVKPFDGVLVCVDDENMDEDKLNSQKVFNHLKESLNFSWDGTIHWFPDASAQKFLEFAQQWFEENYENMSADMDDNSISNCLLYVKTKTGMAFVDTQRDVNSEIDDLVDAFYKTYPDDSGYLVYDDCHLVDNLKFGRDSIVDGDQILKFWVEEGFLTDKVFFYAEEDFFEDHDKDKEIVLTGTFSISREEIKSTLENMDFKFSDKLTSDSWLWVGDKPGNKKIVEASQKGVRISTIVDIMNSFFKGTT